MQHHLAAVVYDGGRSQDLGACIAPLLALPIELVLVTRRPTPIAWRERVVIVRPPREASPGQARNLGFDKVSGEHVVFLDAECEVAPGWYDGLLGALVNHPAAAVVVGEVDVWYPWDPRVYVTDAGPPERNMVVRAAVFRELRRFSGGDPREIGIDFLWRLEVAQYEVQSSRALRCSRKGRLFELGARFAWTWAVRRVNDRYSAYAPQSPYLRRLIDDHLPENLAAELPEPSSDEYDLRQKFGMAVRSIERRSAVAGDMLGRWERSRPGILMAPDWRSNPYQTLFYRSLVERGFSVVGVRDVRPSVLRARQVDCRILHLHWIQGICEFEEPDVVQAVRERLSLASALGYRLVWTVHNEQTHDTKWPQLDRAVRRQIAAAADLVIVHDTSFGHRFARDYRVCPQKIVCMPHGTYVGAYRRVRSGTEQRARLEVPATAPCTLHLGALRPYKGVEELIPVWREVAGPDWRLVIAGAPKPLRLGERLRELAGGDPRIHLVFSRVSDEELPAYLAMADLVVLPYRRILTSGSAMLASSYGRRIVAPRMGALPAVYKEFPELALLYDPSNGLRDALRAWGGLRATGFQPAVQQAFGRFHERYAWSRVTRPVIPRFEVLVGAS